MLSRIAELVYWIGRNVERADDTARLLAMHYYGTLEAGALDRDLLPAALGQVFGASRVLTDPLEPFESVALALLVDRDNPAAVAACLGLARDNARRSREVLALEAWEAVHAAATEFDALLACGAGLRDLLSRTPALTARIFGIADAVLPRNETWRFLRLGIMMERADMTIRGLLLSSVLLSGRADHDPLATHAWSVGLRACGALDSHRTMGVGPPTRESVRGLLLGSDTCPRSLLFILKECQGLLASGRTPWRTAGDLAGRATRAAGEGGCGEDFECLQELLGACHRLHVAIESDAFAQDRWQAA